MIRITRGLDLPIAGAPEQAIAEQHRPRAVAVLGRDYVGLRPTMAVQVGDRVRLGQPLFTDKKNPAVTFTAPGAGEVTAINRGYQRRLLSVVIELDDDEQAVAFRQYNEAGLTMLSRQTVVDQLVESGLWTALRKRPFSKVPNPETRPKALFINAMDTNPLAPDPNLVMDGRVEDFVRGVNLLALLPEGAAYLCLGPDDPLQIGAQAFRHNVVIERFAGPHPAGLCGTHIHFLHPAGVGSEVWYAGYQDVIAIARLFTTGGLSVERVLAFAGPQVSRPRLVRSRLGANLDELVLGALLPGESRVISGSVFAGHKAVGDEAYLGRYHQQVTALREGRERAFMGYLSPGADRHSVMGIYLSGLYKSKKLPLTTNAQGSERAMVPIGAYEKVMPLDILPTPLLRALIVGDIEMAQNLGALELDEEDLALCSYVCPGKYEYGSILRDNLTRIEKEG